MRKLFAAFLVVFIVLGGDLIFHAWAQTNTFCANNLVCNLTHTFVALDTNNTFTGSNVLPSINKVIYWDGTTYPFTAAGLQAGLNAACNGTAPGTFILTPNTVSMGSTQLNIPNNCDVGGNGQTIVVLSWSGSTNNTLIGAASGTPTSIHIHDFTIDGSSGTGSSEAGILMQALTSPTDITIERVTVQNLGSYGIAVSGTSANPGSRVKVIGCKIINAGLATGSAGQLYGIQVANNNRLVVQDNEIFNGALTTGISAFNGTNASSASAIIDIQIIGNRIHDLAFNTTPGAGIDVGRARNAVAVSNSCWNLAMGGCITFESVWGGTVANNVISVADSVITGGPIVIKIPDTTQSGEVASQDITVSGNTIQDSSAVGTTNAIIAIQGAMRNISVTGNTLSYLNLPTNSPNMIYLQTGTSDANIAASGQNFCSQITVTGNSLVQRGGISTTTAHGIAFQQVVSGCVLNQVEIANNTINGFSIGITWVSASASNGITNTYVRNNTVQNCTNAFTNDGKTYTSLFYTDEATNTRDNGC